MTLGVNKNALGSQLKFDKVTTDRIVNIYLTKARSNAQEMMLSR